MERNYNKSNALLERAKKVTPLGTQTYSKSYRYYCEGSAPAFIDHGEGCYVYDIDGNEFIDFVCGLGPVTIGYNDKRVNTAIINQLRKGISFSLQTEVEVLLAEKLVDIIPCAEMVRFVKNGGDATTAAVRLARAYTNRDVIAFSGYHGMHDWYIGATSNNRGVPKAIQTLSKPFIYNDLDYLEKLFNEYSGKIAAVIIEPIQGNGPNQGYLKRVKELAHNNGGLLIFDEVVSGFRYALGGASELYEVTPDLAAFGKGMANGLPISAVAGKAEIMKLIEDGIFISTTFGGEALSIAGALETIKILEEPGAYEHIWNLGGLMKNGLIDLIDKYELNNVLSVSGLEPHCGLLFEGSGKLDYLDINSIFSNSMTEYGVLSVGINNLSQSHTKKEIDIFLAAAEEGMKNINIAIKADSMTSVRVNGRVDPVFKRNIK